MTRRWCAFVHFLVLLFTANKIGADGARALADALKVNSTLRELKLASACSHSNFQCIRYLSMILSAMLAFLTHIHAEVTTLAMVVLGL
jgi:hypothetical protein